MKKKRLILSLIIGLSLLAYSGFSFADGPDLDDHTIVNSGPGVGLGNHDFLLSTNEIYQEIHKSQHGREEA